MRAGASAALAARPSATRQRCRARARTAKDADGKETTVPGDTFVLTPRQIIDKFRAVKMVDVVMPTTDGRIVTLPRYVEPKPDLAVLLDRLGLTLPVQPRRKSQAKLPTRRNRLCSEDL